MYNLMIIESPGKRKKLDEILAKIQPGVKWRIEASIGHIRDLPSKGVAEGHIVTGIKADFTPTYELTERGGEVVERLSKLAKGATAVYLATDPDREGESISWHLKEAIGLANPIRVAFNDISVSAVQAALANPRLIDMPMVLAQEARRALDRIVGYEVSSELYRQTNLPLSAGRVQSPAVRLVVERERAIRNFRQTEHFGAKVTFAHAKVGPWHAEWMTEPDFVNEQNPYFMDQAFAAQVAAMKQVVVISCEETEEKRNPPAPFSTSLLQQAASTALKFNPKKTMDVAQKLYEQGHISYMRTDNPNIGDDSMPKLAEAARAMGLELEPKKRTFKAKDGAQEGHPAITPSHWDVADAGETDDERALYKLIRVRAIASQMLASRSAVRTIWLKGMHPVEGREVAYAIKGKTLVFKGWKELQAEDVTEEKSDGDDTEGCPVPSLEPGEVLDTTGGQVLVKHTKAPKRYTEASLVKALESEGIGRPATYAAIMENIIDKRGYVVVEKRQLKPTPVGEHVIDRLVNNFEFIELGFTSDLEDLLDAIANRKAAYRTVVGDLYHKLKKEIEAQVSKVPSIVKNYPCPKCQSPLRRLTKGPHGAFWSCTKYPECDGKLPDENGKPGQNKGVTLSKFGCKKCGKPLIFTDMPPKDGKKGVKFWGCSGLKAGCKTIYPDLNGEPNYAKVN
jgi:DNA topoisomerase-1